MGYYTKYKLTVTKNGKEVDSSLYPQFEYQNLYDGGMSIQELIDGAIDSMKWYQHDDDMLECSKAYPELLFVLDGNGEEGGDIWRKFYKNGKTYEWRPEISRPEFEEEKLQ